MNESPSRRSWVAPAIAFFVTFVLVAGTTAIITFQQPKRYAGTVRIRFMPIIPAVKADRQADPVTPDSSVVRLQFEVMRSQVVLEKVIAALDLNAEWGKRYAGGELLKTAETIALLRPEIELQSSKSGQAVVQVFNESPEEAAKIANAIAKAYSEHRLEWRRGVITSDLEDFQKQHDSEALQIGPKEAEANKLRSEFNLSDADPTGPRELPSSQALIRQLQSRCVAAQAALVEQLTLLTNISKLPSESQRLALKAALNADDKLQTQLNEANRVNGESTGKVDSRVQSVLKELTNRVARLQQAVADANSGLERTKSNAVAYAEAAQRFDEIAPEVEISRKRRLAISEKMNPKKAELAALKSDVEIIEEATAAKKPARPDIVRNLGFGAVAGLILALGAGWLASRLFP